LIDLIEVRRLFGTLIENTYIVGRLPHACQFFLNTLNGAFWTWGFRDLFFSSLFQKRAHSLLISLSPNWGQGNESLSLPFLLVFVSGFGLIYGFMYVFTHLNAYLVILSSENGLLWMLKIGFFLFFCFCSRFLRFLYLVLDNLYFFYGLDVIRWFEVLKWTSMDDKDWIYYYYYYMLVKGLFVFVSRFSLTYKFISVLDASNWF
jgi:hypothetical protein